MHKEILEFIALDCADLLADCRICMLKFLIPCVKLINTFDVSAKLVRAFEQLLFAGRQLRGMQIGGIVRAEFLRQVVFQLVGSVFSICL